MHQCKVVVSVVNVLASYSKDSSSNPAKEKILSLILPLDRKKINSFLRVYWISYS